MTELSWSYLQPALPELFMALAGLVLLVVGVFRGDQFTARLSWIVTAVFAVTMVILSGLEWDRVTTFGGLFVFDSFAAFMKLLILIGLIASLVLSVRYLQQEGIARFEYPILILFAGLGMMIMVSANNLLSLYVGLELQSLCLYVLAAFQRNHVHSAEAGIKYFVLGALASGMLLFGASFVYGYTGTTDFTLIAQTLSGMETVNAGFVVGLVFVLVGIAFKLSAVPFHMWTPDVYEGAPTSVTALFSIVPKVAALGLLMRLVFEPFGPVIDQWQQVLWLLAILTMTLPAFAALVQDNIKRLMAYSSIGNMGYALIGVVSGTADGSGAAVLYIMIYMVMTAGVFAVILTMRRTETVVEKIEDLAGLSRNHPVLAYAMAVLMFSMAGIPPFAGFFGKLFVFEAAVAAGMYGLAIVGVLTSVVAAYYYLRIIKVMFFDKAADPFDPDMPLARRAVLLLTTVFIVGFILIPDSFVVASRAAAATFFP